MSAPRVRARYLVTAVLLGFGVPIAALFLRYVAAAVVEPSAEFNEFVSRELRGNTLFYLAVMFGTLTLCSLAAWLLGTRTDRLAVLAKRLEGMAMRDAVTGLFNRRYMEHRLASEISRAERTRRPLSCLVVRIAGFDRLAATVAEPDLEPVLCDMAFLLKATCRDLDVVGRHDDGAFLLVLPETDLYNAWIVSTRVLDAVAAGRFTLRGDPWPVAINIGGAEVDHEVRWSDQLLEAAHAALERSCATGENRVMLHDPASRRPEAGPAPERPSSPAHA